MNHLSSVTIYLLLFCLLPYQALSGQRDADSLCFELRFASWEGDSAKVRSILDSIAVEEVDCAPWGEPTALSYAVMEGHYSIVEMLLKHGAGLEPSPGTYISPLDYAIRYDHPWVLELLIIYGANLNKQGTHQRTPLIRAVNAGGDITITDMLLHYGANTELALDDGTTPLLLSVMYGDLERTLLLIDYGANVNQADLKGYTPLMVSSMLNDTLMTQWLLYFGASPDSVNRDGWRALDFAISSRAQDVVTLLMPFTQPENLQTSLTLAYAVNNRDMIQLLRDSGITPGRKPIITATTFRFATASNNHHELWQYQVGVEDRRYNLMASLGFLHRRSTTTIFHDPPQQDTISYQLQGFRRAFFINIEKQFRLVSDHRITLLLNMGVQTGFTWGAFRGSTMKPQNGFMPGANIGICLTGTYLMGGIGYQFLYTHDKPVSPHHLMLQTSVRIPDKKYTVTPKPLHRALRFM